MGCFFSSEPHLHELGVIDYIIPTLASALRAKLSPSERRQCLPTLAKSSLRKARKGRRSMVEPRCVPSCSRRSVFCLFLRLLEATESQPFTQRTLQEMGVPQYRQALTLLKGLELVTPAGRLQDDVLASRHDPERFKTLLHGRVLTAWNAAGCRDEELSFLGQDLPGKQLAERLRTLSPINRLKTESARSAARSTLRALGDLLVHLPNREWFENELRALEAKEAGGPR